MENYRELYLKENVMVKQAEQKDIPIIEEILLDAVNWLQSIGMDNKWTNRSVLWENLSKEYNITDFYIAYEGQQPAACMALYVNQL